MSPPARTNLLDSIAEERIAEAIRRGDFDNLPGAGKPLALDDDPLVPHEVRAMYRVVKNAGFVPPEILERREANSLEALIPTLADAGQRARAIARLAVLRTRLGSVRGSRLTANRQYTRRIIEKLAGG